MPKVSVIIPTYNRAEYLKQAIASALGQTFEDFELLIVDDCSSDNTSRIIENCTDTRIRYIRNNENKGISAVRNIGINNSRGEYIAFLDDDDEWFSDKLEKQVSMLEPSSPKLGAIYTGVVSVNMANNKVVKLRIPQYRGNILKKMLLQNFIPTPSIVLKKACFEKVGLFDERVPYGEDHDMWIRVAEKFEFDYVEDLLVKHRVHENSISSNISAVIMGLERLIAKHQRLFVNYKRAYSNNQFKLGAAYCYDGNIKLGRGAFIKAIKLNPLDLRLYYNLAISMLGAEGYKKLKETKKNYFTIESQNQYNN
ncbi:MAG: glycosyltransferase [Deltaproteobacteria bacterium]